MGEKLPSWKSRSIKSLDQLFMQKQFQDDLKKVDQKQLSPSELIKKYEFPIYAITYVKHYINTRKKDPDKIIEPYMLVSEKLKIVALSKLPHLEKVLVADDIIKSKELYLLIHAPTTKQELLDYIDLYWKSDLEPLIEMHFDGKAKRIRNKPNLKENEKLYRKRLKGVTPKQLEDGTDLSAPEISARIYKYKK
ncbi:hypothetical protein H0W80_04240 [Candidatus Saccharibacteria bacterium]|nr:hypothetical protein [Candidatus Saccharibacteria bacterium]